MTSQEIFEQERDKIFHRCWIYIGHDSEVDKPGDFVARRLLGHPLFLLRDQAGEVRCFYNSCPHRGAVVCREPNGNAKRFTCFYHAWTFDLTGTLVAMPDEAGYGAGFDRSDRCLVGPPRLEQYRGFWFVGFDAGIEPLDDYLAGAKEYLDLVVDQAEDGMRVIKGSNQYSIQANWKLLVENSIDGYHGLPLHQTYFAYIKSLGGGRNAPASIVGTPRQLGNGHVVCEVDAPYGRPIAHWDPLFGEDAREEIEHVRSRLFEKFGPERGGRMSSTCRNLLVFPNLVVNDITAITVRYMDPVAPDLINVSAWALAPREEAGSSLARRIDSYLTFIGPGGLATPDDVEALEACQQGFMARPDLGYSDISRGMARNPGVNDEFQMRAFWRAWAALMKEEPFPDPVTVPETVALASVP
jgi:p-cumate 2,3-dioxygenase alpha subunit